MRVLRNLCLIVIPILLMINLYRFTFTFNDYSFRGFSYLYQYIGTFNGFNTTLNTLSKIGEYGTKMLSYDNPNIFETLGNGFMMLFYGFSIPVMVIIDIVMDLMWVLNMFFGV